MLDLSLIRDDCESVRVRLRDRLPDVTILDRILETDSARRQLLHQTETVKARRNGLVKEIARLRSGRDVERLKNEARTLGDHLKDFEAALAEREAELRAFELTVPNVPHPTVPVGRASEANVEVRRWGEPRSMPFRPRPHWEVGPALGLDQPRGTRMAGSRFYALKGDLALLEIALIHFMLDVHVREHGYMPVIPPFLVGPRAMVNCGQLPRFADGIYHCKRDDDDRGDNLYLIPTAESALASFHQDEILDAAELPLRYVGYSPCFRREAGAAGLDTRGILRVHQFHKVELFKFTTPESSYEELEALVQDAETILQALELPYRVVLLSTGDMGGAAAKTYDLEVWLSGQGMFREISSCSNVEAYQARRANTRYRPGAGLKPRYVHMLNGSGLAVGRTMIAILENYQEVDGSVVVPAALHSYLGGRDRIVPEQRDARGLVPAQRSA